MARKAFPLLVLVAAAALTQPALACPFCSGSGQQTLTEEMQTMDIAVVAKLISVPPPTKPGEEFDDLPKAKFEVVQVLKGDKVQPKQKIETLYFGSAKPGSLFFICALEREMTMWSTPMPITARGQEYLAHLLKLPKEGADRLAFFQDYLDDEDDVLARDAYDEFAKAPYDVVRSLKPRLKHDKIVEWIQNSDTPTTRRRLFFTLLGVCGDKQDLPMLEKYIRSEDRKQKAGLDALIACYILLRGPEALDVIDDLYLKRKTADYAETFSAIMALRFHATEANIVSKKRLIESFRLMLDRPELADLIIPDLAKWEDWDSMDRLMELFKKADEKSSWVRTPVVVYLRSCPLPKAKELIEECKKIDAPAVKRAMDFYPTQPADTSKDAKKTSSRIAPTSKELALKPRVANNEGTNGDEAQAPGRNTPVASVNEGVAPAAAARETPMVPLGRAWLLGVPLTLAAALFVVQRQILLGGR
jgi:hypothetical protein